MNGWEEKRPANNSAVSISTRKEPGTGGQGLKRLQLQIGMGHDFRIFDLIIEYRLGCVIIF